MPEIHESDSDTRSGSHEACVPARDRIVVWRVAWKPEAPFDAVLSEEEQARAAAIRHCARREEFCRTRSALRRVLARYLGKDAETLHFNTSNRGKPFLDCPPHTGIEFNVSHCERLALIAVAVDTSVGVDIEALRPRPSAERIAKRFFTASEQEWVNCVSGEKRLQRFYAIWCRKEACLKAAGAGITLPLERLDTLSDTVRLPQLPGAAFPVACLRVKDISAEDGGYAAAVAYAGVPRQVQICDWVGGK